MSEHFSTPDACAWVPRTTREPVVALSATYAPTPWEDQQPPTLADLTTLGVGGPVERYVEATTSADLVDAVREADAAGIPVLVIGGGSNIVGDDSGFAGWVVRDVRQSIEVVEDTGCGGATVRVAAGVGLDALVARAIEEGWMGLEALSGIPGTVGASPVQNVGAYGHEVAEVISSVTTYDRLSGQRKQLALAELGFGYRTSVLKRSVGAPGVPPGPTPRWVVTEVEFAFRHATLSAPIAYAQLAGALGVEVGERVDAARVREAVLQLRRGKSMVLDPADPNARSAGSFFTNPVVTRTEADRLPADAPRYPVYDYTARTNIADAPPVVDGVVKVSAAWLIEHAGIARGFRLDDAASARVSGAHTLALTTCGPSPCSADLHALAAHIRDRVATRFGVTLVPEPIVLPGRDAAGGVSTFPND